jgi:hypothetical protein
LPTIAALADRAPAMQAASRAAGTAVCATARQPAVVGTPAMSIRSLTASRTPLAECGIRLMNVPIWTNVAGAGQAVDVTAHAVALTSTGPAGSRSPQRSRSALRRSWDRDAT